jgi:hypothetical protein
MIPIPINADSVPEYWRDNSVKYVVEYLDSFCRGAGVTLTVESRARLQYNHVDITVLPNQVQNSKPMPCIWGIKAAGEECCFIHNVRQANTVIRLRMPFPLLDKMTSQQVDAEHCASTKRHDRDYKNL